MSEPPLPDVPGHLLDRIVGRGATSVVWAGRDAMERPVAIKVPHSRADATDLSQSVTERHVLMAVSHEHLVPLRDVVPMADGRVATVFDLVDGASLRSMVDARGHLRAGEAVTVLTPICDAVATLHRAGATHGDISPGNVLLTADGRPLLADLGAARVAGSGAVVLGTPGFVAPEVSAGEPPGEASDVFALGALAWYCLTGNGAPDTPIRLTPETVVSHVGPELAEAVAACIDPDAERRPPAARLAALFYAATAAEPIEVVVGGDETAALTHRIRAAAAASRPQADPARPNVPVRRLLLGWDRLRRGTRSRVALVLAGAGLLAALGAGFVWPGAAAGWPGDRGQTPEASTPSAGPTPGQRPRTAAAHAGTTPLAAATSLSAAAPSRDTTATAAATPADDGLIDEPEAPRERPADLVRLLAVRRTALLVARDARALDTVHLRSSPSWRADAGLLEALRRSGQRYDGLGVAGVQARHISGSTAGAVIRARVDLRAYDVVDQLGQRTRRPAVTGDLLDFALVWTAQGWRIDSITVPAAT